jgi:glutamine phosphoribosylpyrophosphate amidotransferase
VTPGAPSTGAVLVTHEVAELIDADSLRYLLLATLVEATGL